MVHARGLALVRVLRPQARFFLVGRDPAPALQALDGQNGITVTGTVEEPADWIARAAVCVAPIRAAAGLQNKLLEAMAMAKAVVATPEANEGIGAPVDEALLLARSPDRSRKPCSPCSPIRPAATGWARRPAPSSRRSGPGRAVPGARAALSPRSRPGSAPAPPHLRPCHGRRRPRPERHACEHDPLRRRHRGLGGPLPRLRPRPVGRAARRPAGLSRAREAVRELSRRGKRLVVLSNSGRRAANSWPPRGPGLRSGRFRAGRDLGRDRLGDAGAARRLPFAGPGRRCFLLTSENDRSFVEGLELTPWTRPRRPTSCSRSASTAPASRSTIAVT